MSTDNFTSFKNEKKTAFVIGFTGECGKALVQELAVQPIFAKIILLGRRKVTLQIPETVAFEQAVIDFDNMEASSEFFKQDVGFCCLGTTRGKSGKEGFRRVDFDYTVKSGQIAREQGCQHFHLVSSSGANKNSSFLYMKVKGQAEDSIAALGFPRLSIYRPKMLLCDREESRFGEKLFACLCCCCIKCCVQSIGTPTDLLARAMINNTVLKTKSGTEILENEAIFRLDCGSS